MKKCLTCPYKLGLIKCKCNPCLQCKQSGRKTHPFQIKGIIRNLKQVRKTKADAKKAFGVDENDRIILSFAFRLRNWITIVPQCDHGCDAVQTLRNAVLEALLYERKYGDHGHFGYVRVTDRLLAAVVQNDKDKIVRAIEEGDRISSFEKTV